MQSTVTFFSIVIPTYNRAHLIERALTSILNQTLQDYEILVVDDGSNDNTGELIQKLNITQLKYIKTQNFGVAHARNVGIKNAGGSYITFLDSDDLMEPHHLFCAKEEIIKNNFPDTLHLNFKWGSLNKSFTHTNVLPDKLPNDLFNNCSLHVNCFFMSGKISEQIMFNESRELMFAEDWDFFLKVAVRYKIILVDKITIFLVDHEGRNMRNFDESKWLIKKEALIKSLKNDQIIARSYNHKIRIVQAHMDSLISVNLAVRKSKKRSLFYFFNALKRNPAELFTRRTLAIFKHILLPW